MKKVCGLFVLGFFIFGTCVLAAPPTFGPPAVGHDPDQAVPITYPQINGTWEGPGRDIHKLAPSNPETGGPYDVELKVIEQDGPRFVARFLAEGISGEIQTSGIYPSVAGHITKDGEITMFGGWPGTENTWGQEENYSILLTIKAKLYDNPRRRSIRHSGKLSYGKQILIPQILVILLFMKK